MPTINIKDITESKIVRLVDLSEDSINRIAEAVVQKIAEPIRHGRWIRNDNDTWSCSECQTWIPDEQHYYARYCLYCGAEMDEEINGNN